MNSPSLPSTQVEAHALVAQLWTAYVSASDPTDRDERATQYLTAKQAYVYRFGEVEDKHHIQDYPADLTKCGIVIGPRIKLASWGIIQGTVVLWDCDSLDDIQPAAVCGLCSAAH